LATAPHFQLQLSTPCPQGFLGEHHFEIASSQILFFFSRSKNESLISLSADVTAADVASFPLRYRQIYLRSSIDRTQ
jgi:hypothetical protein